MLILILRWVSCWDWRLWCWGANIRDVPTETSCSCGWLFALFAENTLGCQGVRYSCMVLDSKKKRHGPGFNVEASRSLAEGCSCSTNERSTRSVKIRSEQRWDPRQQPGCCFWCIEMERCSLGQLSSYSSSHVTGIQRLPCGIPLPFVFFFLELDIYMRNKNTLVLFLPFVQSFIISNMIFVGSVLIR